MYPLLLFSNISINTRVLCVLDGDDIAENVAGYRMIFSLGWSSLSGSRLRSPHSK